jgi:hypothetical protein
MKSKSIFKFRCERESWPPACWLVSLAHASEDPQERCPSLVLIRRFGSQIESSSRCKSRRNLVSILSLCEATYAAA